MDSSTMSESDFSILLTGRHLDPDDVARVARDTSVRISLSEEAEAAIMRSRTFVEGLLEGDGQIYGVTTGFGRLADVVIPPAQRESLQTNLITDRTLNSDQTI